MTRSKSVIVPDLRAKLDQLKISAEIPTDNALAKKLGISPSTLAGYLSDTGGSPINNVSRESFTALCKLVAQIAPSVLSQIQAEKLLLADKAAFFGAFKADTRLSLREFLTRKPLAAQLSLHIIPRDKIAGAIECIDDMNDAGTVSAAIGDSISLICNCCPGWQIIMIVESTVGFQLIAPRDSKPLRFGQDGSIRIPTGNRALRLQPPGGLHRIYAICLDSIRTAHIISLERPISILSSTECNHLMDDLENPEITRQWAIGCCELLVKDRDLRN